jgi:pantoate--beta-alanine ligase
MRVSESISEWRLRRREHEGRSIGFVPTMGALHHGHGSLVERCRKENEIVVVSIFVNPTQFNDPSDLDRYPRTMENDLRYLEMLGVDEVFFPTQSEMYPHGYRFRVEPDADTHIMEGAFRPGFLSGVMTVVLKLLNLVQADRAYFGEKDYQQLRTVRDMVEDFFVPTQIVACATVREESGLAASSRNALLPREAKQKAPVLYRALTESSDCEEARALLEREGFRVDYVEDHWKRRFAAAFLGGVRLIDNVALPNEGGGNAPCC